MIFASLQQLKKNQNIFDTVLDRWVLKPTPTSPSTIPCDLTIKNGRSKGTIISCKLSTDTKKRLAKDNIAILYESEKKANGGRLKRGW